MYLYMKILTSKIGEFLMIPIIKWFRELSVMVTGIIFTLGMDF